jgi:hypothetical protein
MRAVGRADQWAARRAHERTVHDDDAEREHHGQGELPTA